jgi:hypothetical protein
MNDPQFDIGEKPYAPGPGYYAEPPVKTRGCFFYGCIAAIVVSVLGLLLVAAGLVTLWYFANKYIQEYTSTTPVTLPKVTLPDEKQRELEDRWEAFRKAVDEGKEAEIVLTADEVNALMAREPNLKGKVYVTIKDDQVTAQISLPLDALGLRGRYLNGSGTVTAEAEDGELDVRLRDLEVKGKRLPPQLKAQIGGENLAKEYVKNPDNREMIRKFQSIRVKDDKVYIKARDRSKSPDKADAESKAPTPAPAEEGAPGDRAPRPEPKGEDKSGDAPKKSAA